MEVGLLQGRWALSPTGLVAGCSLLVGKAEESAGVLEEQEHPCLPSWGVYILFLGVYRSPHPVRGLGYIYGWQRPVEGLGPAHLPDTRHSPCPLIINMFLPQILFKNFWKLSHFYLLKLMSFYTRIV